MKLFRLTIASRYMYNEYRQYSVYFIQEETLEKAKNRVNEYLKKWTIDSNNTTNYELFDIEEIERKVDYE